MLAKITSKNQLTLPKSVTESIGPVQYFEVQAQGGQIILTPVRIQRGDALRAKLAELALDAELLENAFSWTAENKPGRKNRLVKPLSAARKSRGPKGSGSQAKLGNPAASNRASSRVRA